MVEGIGIIALLALALDVAIGWPSWLYARVGHPVGAFARVISFCERHGNPADGGQGARRIMGCATLGLLLVFSGGMAWALQSAALSLSPAYGWVLVAIMAWPALAQRSLHDHVRAVWVALDDGDVPAARMAVAKIVGRDVEALDRHGIARAGIESLSESFCDGVVAPLFWLLIGGLPGVWAYKAINTADSIIGHPEPPLRAFGWAAARVDDGVNLAPARLSGIILCVAGGGGWRTMWRDHARHASPNGGWPESAMAGALGVQLAGPICYDGVMTDKPWIGDGGAAGAADLRRALIVYRRACGWIWALMFGVIFLGVLWRV